MVAEIQVLGPPSVAIQRMLTRSWRRTRENETQICTLMWLQRGWFNLYHSTDLKHLSSVSYFIFTCFKEHQRETEGEKTNKQKTSTHSLPECLRQSWLGQPNLEAINLLVSCMDSRAYIPELLPAASQGMS